MIIKNIIIHNFRNINELDITFDKSVNFFYGKNGSGKSNLLEAIHYLINVKSFRESAINDLIQWNKNRFNIRGEIEGANFFDQLEIDFSDGKRILKKNQKAIRNLSDYHKDISSVSFSPKDIELIRGEPRIRRKFFDRAIYSVKNSYLENYLSYYRVIKNKNKILLSNHHQNEIDPWLIKQAEIGAELFISRFNIVNDILPIIKKTFSIITKKDDLIDITYTPAGISLEEIGTKDINLINKQFYERLKECYGKEKNVGCSLIGPHRDNYDIYVNGKPSKNFSSQGESKSITIAFKLAEVLNFKEKKEEFPIFIIDDFSSEIDNERKTILLDYLMNNNIQLFISSTSDKEMQKTEKTSFYQIDDGKIVM